MDPTWAKMPSLNTDPASAPEYTNVKMEADAPSAVVRETNGQSHTITAMQQGRDRANGMTTEGRGRSSAVTQRQESNAVTQRQESPLATVARRMSDVGKGVARGIGSVTEGFSFKGIRQFGSKVLSTVGPKLEQGATVLKDGTILAKNKLIPTPENREIILDTAKTAVKNRLDDAATQAQIKLEHVGSVASYGATQVKEGLSNAATEAKKRLAPTEEQKINKQMKEFRSAAEKLDKGYSKLNSAINEFRSADPNNMADASKKLRSAIKESDQLRANFDKKHEKVKNVDDISIQNELGSKLSARNSNNPLDKPENSDIKSRVEADRQTREADKKAMVNKLGDAGVWDEEEGDDDLNYNFYNH